MQRHHNSIMGFRIISQIALIVTAVLILVMYVQPTFGSIKATQDQIYQYQQAAQNATQYNQTLAGLLQKIDGFAPSDVTALNTFLPAKIDPLAVMSDINTIAHTAQLQVGDLKVGTDAPGQSTANTSGSDTSAQNATSTTLTLKPTDFTLKANGSYNSLKQFLLLLAQNKYQLDITKFAIDTPASASTNGSTGNTATAAQAANGGLSYDMTIRAYALTY